MTCSETTAENDLDFEVHEGAPLLPLGPSGCGRFSRCVAWQGSDSRPVAASRSASAPSSTAAPQNPSRPTRVRSPWSFSPTRSVRAGQQFSLSAVGRSLWPDADLVLSYPEMEIDARLRRVHSTHDQATRRSLPRRRAPGGHSSAGPGSSCTRPASTWRSMLPDACRS